MAVCVHVINWCALIKQLSDLFPSLKVHSKAETRSEEMRLGYEVFHNYFVRSVNQDKCWANVLLLVGLAVVTQGANLFFDWWLTHWVDNWQQAENEAGVELDDDALSGTTHDD